LMAILVFMVGGGTSPAVEPRPVRIVYFYTTDREPLENHAERIDRTMREVQEFYRVGMREYGYDQCFALERDADGKLVIHYVPAQKPMSGYGRDSAWEIRNEVRKYLLGKEQIDIDQETIVLFETLLRWNDDHTEAAELGPYCGWGTPVKGTAWVYDDPMLDSARLSSKEPGGFYMRPCSIGEFNSHYVGGIAHELGHAFSLPHDCERTDERRERGASLMGGGNHTFGQEQRGEGRGTFLTETSAARLAQIRPFRTDYPEAGAESSDGGNEKPSEMTLTDLDLRVLKAEENDGVPAIRVEGNVNGTPTIVRMILYLDCTAIRSDYDAIGSVAKIDEKGRFSLVADDFSKARDPSQRKWELRLTGVHENGTVSMSVFTAEMSEDGELKLDHPAVPAKQ
ncbi:MAG: hypothetical protein Q4C47_09705, partial [Planctomycetia bacterium]|nr:hypothetical protein [Planctomycetia bacterium]